MIRRILLAAVIMYAVWFAVQGGQFGTWELWKQRQERAQLQQRIDSLQKHVDSLRTYRARLDTDRALQEKLARENVGMVRGDKELLYLITPKDSSRGRKPE
jgi:cell division protein FtsB